MVDNFDKNKAIKMELKHLNFDNDFLIRELAALCFKICIDNTCQIIFKAFPAKKIIIK